MNELKLHEQFVLDYLVSNIIDAKTLAEIKAKPKISSYDTTGHGYFITIHHPNLPENRIVSHKPLILGESDGIETSFVVFIENRELTIECHGLGDIKIPGDYRDSNIKVRKA